MVQAANVVGEHYTRFLSFVTTIHQSWCNLALCHQIHVQNVLASRTLTTLFSSLFQCTCCWTFPSLSHWFFYLIEPFFGMLREQTYRASLVEPWFVCWGRQVSPEYPWWDQTSLMCYRSVPKKIWLAITVTKIRPSDMHDIVATSGHPWLDIAGYQKSRHGFWLANCQYGYDERRYQTQPSMQQDLMFIAKALKDRRQIFDESTV